MSQPTVWNCRRVKFGPRIRGANPNSSCRLGQCHSVWVAGMHEAGRCPHGPMTSDQCHCLNSDHHIWRKVLCTTSQSTENRGPLFEQTPVTSCRECGHGRIGVLDAAGSSSRIVSDKKQRPRRAVIFVDVIWRKRRDSNPRSQP